MSLATLQQRVAGIHSSLDPRQRLIALMGAGAAVLALAVLALSAGQEPEFAVAFSGLHREDASAIVARLREQGVPYRISSDEATVRVPAAQVHDVRLDMASVGLPSGGTVGFEIFDTTNLGMTDFTQQVNYRRALEGELARTVSSLEAVHEARVHIVMPQPSIYTSLERKPSASVLLRLHPAKSLTQEQVRGIAHLVSSSVEGLTPDNITIVDTSGTVLSDMLAEGQQRVTDQQFQAQRDFERSLEAKLRSMLETTLGPGRAAVSVSAQFDWSEVQTSRESYETPVTGTPVVRSAREVREVQGDGGPATGGVPGVDANVPSVPSYTGVLASAQAGTQASSQGYERSDVTYNYEVSKVVSHSVTRPGRLERLSVSVLLDNVSDEALLESVRQAVEAAAGVDMARGDRLTVETLAFDRSHIEQAEAALARTERELLYLSAARWGALALGGVIALLLVRSLVLRAFAAPPRKGARPKTITTPQEALQAGTRQLLSQGEAGAALGPGEDEPSVADLASTQHQLITLAQRQPEVLAQVIQFWLSESDPRRRR
ncbi:MAG: flagellar M-ring protein FliF [Anaerolineae bacterium]|nr:flagellar M-ring protein FliF [Anaerolineae bacterium]